VRAVEVPRERGRLVSSMNSTPTNHRPRAALALLYLAVAAWCFASTGSCRVFWTVLMPIVPLGVVLIGFHAWRRVCPIATLGALGARLHRGKRRVPKRWRRAGLPLSLAVLVATLVLRLVTTNGDGAALGTFLLALPLTAVLLNALFGGRSFCHHACPIGVVERIYTDAAPPLLVRERGSGCATCSGCVKGCADLDRERAYERTREDRGRRLVFFAFPGVVFGFYLYYFLRAGTWEAYFDGRWTESPATLDGILGPGFFFAPAVPAVLAALVTLLVCGACSYLLFTVAEHFVRDRHRTLALASFTAFNVFYVFAGAPTLRLVPALQRLVVFVVPVVATLVLVRRFARPTGGLVTLGRAR